MYSRQAVGLNAQDTSASNGFSGIIHFKKAPTKFRRDIVPLGTP